MFDKPTDSGMQAFRLTVFYDVLTVMSIENAFLTQGKEGIL